MVDRAPSFNPMDSGLTVSKIETVAGVSVVQLSDRTRKDLHHHAFAQVIHNVVRSDNSLNPGDFDREIINAVVDEFGADVTKNIVKSYRPSPDRYRSLLRAINDRSRISSRDRGRAE